MRLPTVPCSSSVRTDTGTSARISTPSVRRPRGDQERAQRARDDREHDVVDGAAERVLDELEVLEAGCRRRRSAGAGRSGRSAASPAPGSARPTRSRRSPRRPRGRAPARARGGPARRARPRPARAPARTAPRTPAATQLGGARLGVRLPGAARVSDRRRVGREVEQHRREVDARDAVDQRVVGLGDQREAVVLEALDQPHLPQRLGAVELLGEDARGQVLQLLLAARRGQRGVAHVVLEVEARVVDPHGRPLSSAV